MIIEAIKNSTFYKLIRTVEAVAVIGLPFLFYFLGMADLATAIWIASIYIVLNVSKYANKRLYELRDDTVEVFNDIVEDIKELFNKKR